MEITASLTEELIEFNKQIPWTSNTEDLSTYYNYLLDENLIVIERNNDDQIVGVVELFRMNCAYLGYYMLVGDNYYNRVHTYEVNNPNVLFIANWFLDKEHRGIKRIRSMKAKMIPIGSFAEYVVGHNKFRKTNREYSIMKNIRKGV